MSLARKTCSEAFWAVSGTPTKHALSIIAPPDEDAVEPCAWIAEGIQDLKHLLDIMTNLLHMRPFDVKGAGQENSANSLVVKPVSGKDGPLYGAIDRIEGLINSVVVRTRSVSFSCFIDQVNLTSCDICFREGDISAEVTLPPCAERKQGLDLDYYGNLTYNVLQCKMNGFLICDSR